MFNLLVLATITNMICGLIIQFIINYSGRKSSVVYEGATIWFIIFAAFYAYLSTLTHINVLYIQKDVSDIYVFVATFLGICLGSIVAPRRA